MSNELWPATIIEWKAISAGLKTPPAFSHQQKSRQEEPTTHYC